MEVGGSQLNALIEGLLDKDHIFLMLGGAFTVSNPS